MMFKASKRFAVLLSMMLVFALGAPAVSAAVPADSGSGDEEEYREEKVGQPGEEVTLGGWTIKSNSDDDFVEIVRKENGDGKIISIAHIYSVKGALTTEVNVEIEGSVSADHLIFWGNPDYQIRESDKIKLSVDCDDPEISDGVKINFPVRCFSDKTENPDFRDRVIEVEDYSDTVCFKKWLKNRDGEEGDKPAWMYEFYNMDSRKKVEVGGWTISDNNVTGDGDSCVVGGEDKKDDNMCWADVWSPSANKKPIDTVITGTTDAKNLEFGLWDHTDENGYDRFRRPKEGDKVLIDVTKPENGRAGDSVSVYFSGWNLPDEYEKDPDYVNKIFAVKDNPGIKYELTTEEDVHSDGETETLWVFSFEIEEEEKTDTEKRNELAAGDRKTENGSKTERTQVLGDTLKMAGEKSGKKWVFSLTGLKDKKGIQKLTVNALAKFNAEDLKGLDLSKVTVSFNGADGSSTEGTEKDVKKLLKINKKGQVTVKADKTHASYTLMIPVNECTLCLTVVNVNFDKKAIKDKKITALQGEGSSVSVNLMQFAGKEAQTKESDFLSADWTLDNGIAVTSTDPRNPVRSKKQMNAYLSEDYRTLTIANPGTVKAGNVKITAVINGRKYSATVKVKVQ